MWGQSPGRSALPGARNPGIYCIWQFGKTFPAIFPNFPRVLLGNARKVSGNSHNLLELSESRPQITQNSVESNRPLTPILLKSIAIHLPFLSRNFCKCMLLLAESTIWTSNLYHDTAPICIATIRVRGWLDTPKKALSELFSQYFHRGCIPKQAVP